MQCNNVVDIQFRLTMLYLPTYKKAKTCIFSYNEKKTRMDKITEKVSWFFLDRLYMCVYICQCKNSLTFAASSSESGQKRWRHGESFNI